MLKVENINLKKGGKAIINDISFEVGDREIFGILGANGAGKSSLAYALMGCPGYQPEHGAIIFNGVDITKKSIDERARLGITLAWQEPARFEGLSVPDFVMLGSAKGGAAQRRAAPGVGGQRDAGPDDAAKEVAGQRDAADPFLAGMRLPPEEYRCRLVDGTLSGGERKKVELASVMAMGPRLAILDEPDSGIDMISQEAVVNMIYGIRDNGGAVILISHEEEVVKIADRAALMCSGLAFKVGKPAEVVEYYRERCKPCASRVYPSPEDEPGGAHA